MCKGDNISISVDGSAHEGNLKKEYMFLGDAKFVHWDAVYGVYKSGEDHHDIIQFEISPLNRFKYTIFDADSGEVEQESDGGDIRWNGSEEYFMCYANGDTLQIVIENEILVMLESSLAPFVKSGSGLDNDYDAWDTYDGYYNEGGSQWPTRYFILLQNGKRICALQGGPRPKK